MAPHVLADAQAWAKEIFGQCDLGDARRTRRIVDIAGRLAAHSGSSLSEACSGDKIAQLGAYRWVRSSKVEAQAIWDGGFKYSANAARSYNRLLAVEDSSVLSYSHSIVSELGEVGGAVGSTKRGLCAHSVLLLDADSEQTIGLIEQRIWRRPPEEKGVKRQRMYREYQDKESFKWQHASQQVANRLGDQMNRVVAVCDREADIYEYLQYKSQQSERFIVRAAQDRCLLQKGARLVDTLSRGEIRGRMQVSIPQRGGRRARNATLTLQSETVMLAATRRRVGNQLEPLTVNAVLASESGTGEDRLCWLLLTSEPIDRPEQVQEVLRCYGLRWRIEEFHKAWKSGAGVEQLRMQHCDNLLRMAAVLALVAVRLLQLREALDNKSLSETSCEAVLGEIEWKVLWVSTQKKKRPPTKPPTLKWAYQAIAKLGGFTDTKKTGRASWATIWRGWSRLNERTIGYRLLRESVS